MSKMMLTAGFLLALCLTGVVAQTTQSPISSCFLEALLAFATQHLDCGIEFSKVVDVSDTEWKNKLQYNLLKIGDHVIIDHCYAFLKNLFFF